MTPAQEAKAYAAANGFVLGTIPATRRYTVRVLNKATGVAIDDPIAEVGGYPAALNAMKRHVEVNSNLARAIQLATTPKLDAAILSDNVRAILSVNVHAIQLASGVELDQLAEAWNLPKRECKVSGKPHPQTDADYRNVLLRNSARRMPVPKLIKYTHRLEFRMRPDGHTFHWDYPSHAQALRELRQTMSNKQQRPIYVNLFPIREA